jgi:hypothetical protein
MWSFTTKPPSHIFEEIGFDNDDKLDANRS